MPEIDPSEITHHLNVSPSFKPVHQKRRMFTPERDSSIKEEVQKLVMVEFVHEVYYPDWLANVVMVKKANGKWRMCVDLIDLNKACPKDSYSLPCICGRILGVQSDQDGRGKLGENILHHKSRFVLLQSNVFWFEKCRGHLLEASQPYVSSTNWIKC